MIKHVSDIIDFNLQSYFEDYLVFMTQHKQLISKYYTQGDSYPKTSFDLFDNLKNRSKLILEKVSIKRDYLVNFSDFEVIDQIENIIHCLELVENYSRWLRSSLFKGKFKQNAEIEVVLRQGQTLESFANEVGYTDRDAGAIDIALRNKIKETDITLEGGVKFRFSYANNNNLILNSIIDNLNGNNLLGKDVKRKLTITNDDLEVLEPYDTFYQTCEILVSLLKNDNPEFPNDGFDKSMLVNKNIINSMLPSYLRQLYNIIDRDDSIADFSVSNVILEKDALKIEVTFKSWLNNEVKQLI